MIYFEVHVLMKGNQILCTVDRRAVKVQPKCDKSACILFCYFYFIISQFFGVTTSSNRISNDDDPPSLAVVRVLSGLSSVSHRCLVNDGWAVHTVVLLAIQYLLVAAGGRCCCVASLRCWLRARQLKQCVAA